MCVEKTEWTVTPPSRDYRKMYKSPCPWWLLLLLFLEETACELIVPEFVLSRVLYMLYVRSIVVWFTRYY